MLNHGNKLKYLYLIQNENNCHCIKLGNYIIYSEDGVLY